MSVYHETDHGVARSIEEGERGLWLACPHLPGDEGYDDWLDSENRFAKLIPTHNLLLFEDQKCALGKLAFVHEDAGCLVFLAPAIHQNGDTEQIAESLFHAAVEVAKSRSVSRLISAIDGVDHRAQLLSQALLATGFVLQEEKLIYTRRLDRSLEKPDSAGFEYAAFDEAKDDGLAQALDLFRDTHQHAAGIDELRKAATGPGRHWRLVYHQGRFIGLSLLRIRDTDASLDLISLVPESRGRGLGKRVFVAALDHARELGAQRYLGSTRVANAPMIRVFEGCGCKLLMQRKEFVFRLQG